MEDIIRAPRTDAIYNMHGYLTKVPVQAIVPFIEEFCPQNGVVVDMFAGSGMTAIAAKLAGRNAVVSDISRLGQHIGRGYLTEVAGQELEEVAQRIVKESKSSVGWLYNTTRLEDGRDCEAIRAVWSFVYSCPHCHSEEGFYRMLEAAGWEKADMVCQSCGQPFDKKRSKYLRDEPVLTVVKGVSGRQVEQPVSSHDEQMLSEADSMNCRDRIPSAEITPDREMYHRSALKKWNFTNTKDFFSQRNSAVLLDLWERINAVDNFEIRQKLLFIFTAILPRASKRYQWSKKAPLNAANQNYYVAPVFYEWNVYELFNRKVSACLKSDALIFGNLEGGLPASQEYVTASADNLNHLADESVDLVFTDPPFGSNIFYSDMNLFQEVWLDAVTDQDREAVIRTTRGQRAGSEERYYQLLVSAFREAYRVLRPGGVLSIVFGNSKGSVWSMAQRSFREAGFVGKPVRINILDKGQRSVKGLASGQESVATLDLIVSIRKGDGVIGGEVGERVDWKDALNKIVSEYADRPGMTASHLYLEVLRQAIYEDRDVAHIDLGHVLDSLEAHGVGVDEQSGFLYRL